MVPIIARDCKALTQVVPKAFSLVALLIGCVAPLRVQADFLYTRVVSSDALEGGFNNIGFTPQLNNNNEVALQLNQASNGFQGGSFSASRVASWQSGALTNIASTGTTVAGQGTINFIGRISLSDSGNVAFRVAYASGGGVLLTTVSGLQQVFSDTNLLNSVRVNSSDRVLTSLQASLGGEITVQSRTLASAAVTLASNGPSGSFGSYGSGGPPSPDINDAGAVALRGVLLTGAQDGIYFIGTSGLQTVASGSDSLTAFGNNVDLNNAGQVAFLARSFADPAGKTNVYVGQLGQSLIQIASQSNFTAIADSGPAINDSGTVLFQATFNGSEAIFSGGNPQTDRIIGVGDSLDGGKITSVTFGRGMLNNTGNFVFYSTLDDNNDGIADRSGVFFAAINSVPEPSLAIYLAALGCVEFVRRRRIIISRNT